jgi:hypothetical protein
MNARITILLIIAAGLLFAVVCDAQTNAALIAPAIATAPDGLFASLYANWGKIAAIFAVVLSSAVHGYQIIVQAGGLKNIYGKFLNGEQDSETPTKPSTIPPAAPETKPAA